MRRNGILLNGSWGINEFPGGGGGLSRTLWRKFWVQSGNFGIVLGCLTAVDFCKEEKWDFFGIVWRMGDIMGESV